MPSTKTDLFLNITGLTVTPAGASAITINEITDYDMDEDLQQEIFYGDNRKNPRAIRNVAFVQRIKFMGGNLAAFRSIPTDKQCTIVFTIKDMMNTDGVGDLTVTITGAVRGKVTSKGQNNKTNVGDCTFTCMADAADDYPITVVQG